jgi:hypothetical protein
MPDVEPLTPWPSGNGRCSRGRDGWCLREAVIADHDGASRSLEEATVRRRKTCASMFASPEQDACDGEIRRADC